MASEPTTSLGWWAISGENLISLLRRVAAGEDPDLIYAEAYANSSIDDGMDDDGQ